MGNNTCCKKDKCNTCTPKSRYCGDNLLCIDINKGDTYDSALVKINEIICNLGCFDFKVKFNPTHREEDPDYIFVPEIEVIGGQEPYQYNWTLQQTGGTSYIIGDPNAETYEDLIDSMILDSECLDPILQDIPCRISYANSITDPTHVWHFKLEVTDANGCTATDYWTHYKVNIY